jgi:hypothetical protein
MDLYYATIPTCENAFVIFHDEQMRRYQIEDPLELMNELGCHEKDLGSLLK